MRSVLPVMWLAWALVLGAWPALVPQHTAAQQAVSGGEDGEPAGYSAVVDEAISEYAAGRFEEARALFTRAHAISPNARTLRGLGMVAFELRSYAECVQQLEQALASKVKPLNGPLRGQTEGLLARARGFVGRFTLLLQPADTRLVVDGNAVQLLAGRTLDLDVGDHLLELSAPGYDAQRRTLRVTGGETRTLEFDLTDGSQLAPAAVASAGVGASDGAPHSAPAGATEADDDGGSLLESPWFWVAAVAVAAGTAVGLGVALSGETTREDEPYGGDSDVVLRGP